MMKSVKVPIGLKVLIRSNEDCRKVTIIFYLSPTKRRVLRIESIFQSNREVRITIRLLVAHNDLLCASLGSIAM